MFCESNVFSNIAYNPLPAGIVGWGVPSDLPYPFFFRCDWYNIPLAGDPDQLSETLAPAPETEESGTGQGNELTIIVVTCPGGPEFPTDLSMMQETCEPHEGMGFGLLSATDSSSRMSDADGQARWLTVPAGNWQLEQTTPAEFGEPEVFCGPAGTSLLSSMPVDAGVIQREFTGEGEQVRCWWFNSPHLDPGGSGRVSVYLYACPEGATYETIAAGWLTSGSSDCDRAEGITITLSYANAAGTGDVQRTLTTDPSGFAFWDDGVPAAPWTLLAPPQQGFGSPIVICRYIDAPPEVEPGWRVHSGVDAGIYADVFALEDMLAECHWFTVPTVDPGGFNRIDLTVHDCPVGTAADAIVTEVPWVAAEGCERAHQIEATLAYADASGSGDILRPLVTDAHGRAFWSDGVPTAAWSLALAPAPGYADPLVMCAYSNPPQGVSPGWRVQQDLVSWVYHDAFEQDDVLIICHWFMLRDGTGQPEDAGVGQFEPEAIDEPTGAGATGSISLTPSGYDIDGANADPMRACRQLTDGISFTVAPVGETSAGDRGRTGDTGRGTVTFDGLPAGSYLVQEAAQAGVADVFVWHCSSEPRSAQTPTAPLSRGTTLTVDLDEGQDLTCLWFNVPASGGTSIEDAPRSITPTLPITPNLPPALEGMVWGEVRIKAFACDDEHQEPSYGPGSLGYLQASCTQPLPVRFLVRGVQASSPAYTPGSTDESGGVVFSYLDLGDVRIIQDNVRGYKTPHVYCRKPGAPSENWTYRAIEAGSLGGSYARIEETLDAAAPTIECEWFSIPLTANHIEGRVSITRYFCLDPDMSLPLAGQCGLDVDRPTTFQVTYDAWDDPPKTLDWTAFLIHIVPIWPLTITEAFPDGFSPPVAHCRVVDYGSRWQTITDLGWLDGANAGTFAFDPIGIHNALRCDWYSIVHSERGSLALHSYICPAQAFTTSQECRPDTTGRSFTLQRQVNGVWQHHSSGWLNRAGGHVWEDLVPGAYRLDPSGGAGCNMTMDHPATGNDTIAVISGQNTIVRVYTCGGGPGRHTGVTPWVSELNAASPTGGAGLLEAALLQGA
jgi:hypothetical protein